MKEQKIFIGYKCSTCGTESPRKRGNKMKNWIKVEDEENAREPIEDALLAMKIVEPDAIPEVAQNILMYIEDADFCIAKEALELPKEG